MRLNILQATDKSFVEKLYIHCSKHRFFEKPRFGALEFLIKHYAGKVAYNVTGFLEKVYEKRKKEERKKASVF